MLRTATILLILLCVNACAGHWRSYENALPELNEVPRTAGRLVLLAPSDALVDYSPGAVIGDLALAIATMGLVTEVFIDDIPSVAFVTPVGEHQVARGGFTWVDLPEGEHRVRLQRYQHLDECALPLTISAGETRYVQALLREEFNDAQAAGGVVAIAATGASVSEIWGGDLGMTDLAGASTSEAAVSLMVLPLLLAVAVAELLDDSPCDGSVMLAEIDASRAEAMLPEMREFLGYNLREDVAD